jgi:L-fuconolactonase
MSGPRRIDAHLHVWDLDRRDQPWIDPVGMSAIRRTFDLGRDLGPQLASSGVGTGVLVQVLNRADETAELLTAAMSSAVIAGVVGWLDLTAADLGDQLARAAELGPLVGVRHQLQAEPDPAGWLERDDVHRGLARLAAAGLPFDLMIRPVQFAAALQAVRRHPSLTFVVDHLGKPDIAGRELEPWAAGVRLLAAEPNVVCKLSGMVTVAERGAQTARDLAPFADVVLEAFGADRTMFGSDWPVCTLAATYAEVVEISEALVQLLTAAERAAVWCDTAVRVYGLA